VAHHARRAEHHLGVDAVDVLLLQARLAAEVALVGGGERHTRPTHLLVLASRGGIDADRRRRDVGGGLPGLAALALGNDARNLVVELLRDVRGPDVGGLEHVRIARDEGVLARHSRSTSDEEFTVQKYEFAFAKSTPPPGSASVTPRAGRDSPRWRSACAGWRDRPRRTVRTPPPRAGASRARRALPRRGTSRAPARASISC